jgi:cell division transport system permease protein
MRHSRAALYGLAQLSRTPFSALVTCIVIGITLALPMALFILLKNVEVLSQHVRQNTQLTLYLKSDINETQVSQLVRSLNKNPAIDKVRAISPTQGLKELQQQAGLDNVLADLQNNPIPWAIVISPKASYHSPEALTHLSQTLKQHPEVDSVQLDILWVERLFALMKLAHRAVYALTLFLGIGVLLIINNCIRSATQHNKKEIDVIKLIGGTAMFIRRPFLYAGMIYGLLGGIIAWELVDLLLLWINSPTEQLAALYHSQFQLLGMDILNTFVLLLSSIGLGLIGAWSAISYHLRSSDLETLR